MGINSIVEDRYLLQTSDVAVNRVLSFYFNAQFGRFLLAGGLAAIANFASRFIFETMFDFAAAVTAAYGVGFTTALILNKLFVFPASGKPVRQEVAWFVFFNVLAFPFTVITTLLLDKHVLGILLPENFSQMVAHAMGIAAPLFATFVAHKLVTFAKP